MKIVDFKKEHIEETKELIRYIYNEEREFVNALPIMKNQLDLLQFADNDFSVIAIWEGKIVGVLCSYPPFDHAFGSTNAKGIFSPMGANAAMKEKREKIYTAMYQVVAKKWVVAGATSHAICLFSHEDELQREFYRLGFGLRCMDAIRKMEEIECPILDGYYFKELPVNKWDEIYPLNMLLNQHYQSSPFFMNRKLDTKEEFLTSAKEDKSRFFVACEQDKICAYYEITESGETCICANRQYLHIKGAFALPEYRGKSVAQNLLNHIIKILKADGYDILGVDFESINPTAYSFWTKYFTPYTHSIVRRIDEDILNIKLL